MGVETAIAMSVLSTGAGMAQGNKAAKAAAAAGKAGQRSYLGEAMSALDTQEKIFQRLPELERKYAPIMQALQRDTLTGQMGIMGDMFSSASQIGGRIGNRMISTYAPTLQSALERGQQGFYRNLGKTSTGMLSMMEQRAAEQLAMGRALSAEEQTMAQQSARAAMGARGLQGGNQAIAAEVLNNYNLATQREQQRIANAQNAIKTRSDLNSMAYSQYGAPLMNLVSQTSPTALLGLATQYASTAGQSSLFQPESQYNADVMGSNANVSVQSALAAAQAKAGMAQGLMSLGGQLAGASIGAYGNIEAAKVAKPPVTNNYFGR